MIDENFIMDDFKEEREMIGNCYKRCFWTVAAMIVIVAIGYLLAGCTTTEYVPVENTHTESHWHTDSIKQIDSVYHEKETTIMQLDSAAMAKYGIQLQNAERAWLVKSWELERQIENLQKLSAERDTVRDSIPVPYPVEKKLTRWQQTKLDYGGKAIVAAIIVIFVLVWLIIKRMQRHRE